VGDNELERGAVLANNAPLQTARAHKARINRARQEWESIRYPHGPRPARPDWFTVPQAPSRYSANVARKLRHTPLTPALGLAEPIRGRPDIVSLGEPVAFRHV
jgi:hypothetical protein